MASAIGPGAAAPAVLSLLPRPTARRFAPRFFRSLLSSRLPRRLPLGALASLLLGALRRRFARSAGGFSGPRAAARPVPSFRPAHLGRGAAHPHVGPSRSARQLVIGHSQTVFEIVRHDAPPSNLRVSVESLSLTKHTSDVKRGPKCHSARPRSCATAWCRGRESSRSRGGTRRRKAHDRA